MWDARASGGAGRANAAAMGLTKNQAVTLAGGLADLLVPMGMTSKEVAALSTKTLGLAGALSEWSGGVRRRSICGNRSRTDGDGTDTRSGRDRKRGI